jgi:hypothetical protein
MLVRAVTLLLRDAAPADRLQLADAAAVAELQFRLQQPLLLLHQLQLLIHTLI